MADNSKTFEEFYSIKKHKICSINEVIDYAELHNGNIQPYVDDMYCPECKKAVLAFVNGTHNRRAYLRKIPSSSHENGCSYNHEYASNKVIRVCAKSMSDEEMSDKIHAILNMLCKEKSTPEQPFNDDTNKTSNPMLIRHDTGKFIKSKAIPRKSLNGWLEDTENIYAFYGKKVKLKVEEKHKKSDSSIYYLLKIYSKNKKGEWHFRVSIYRYERPANINENALYNIALIGQLEKKYKNSYSIRLLTWSAIDYEIVR